MCLLLCYFVFFFISINKNRKKKKKEKRREQKTATTHVPTAKCIYYTTISPEWWMLFNVQYVHIMCTHTRISNICADVFDNALKDTHAYTYSIYTICCAWLTDWLAILIIDLKNCFILRAPAHRNGLIALNTYIHIYIHITITLAGRLCLFQSKPSISALYLKLYTCIRCVYYYIGLCSGTGVCFSIIFIFFYFDFLVVFYIQPFVYGCCCCCRWLAFYSISRTNTPRYNSNFSVRNIYAK